MKERDKDATSLAGRELVITRIFDAPRDLVFKALTDPKQVAQWWGPKGFTNPICEWDARAGGDIRVDMRGPDGNVYPMGGVFREIAPPERLVFTITAFFDKESNPMLENLNTITLEEHEGMTYVTVELFDEGNQTRLKLTHKGLETFPSGNPDFAKENFAEGWTYIVGTALKGFVEAKII